ncbi:MAG: hypothetical protein J6T23_02440 [Elusimicrobia bacterium]|nr:hypothetical protein [Elusimicrobiota bacterium]
MRNNLDMASLVLQIYNLILLMQDFNNTDLMQELQKQDTQYFEKIIKNQEEILKLLKERKNNND